MRLLLINPKYRESFWSFKWAVDGILPAKRAINPPLGLATLAALCPPHWQVEIIDENIESLPLNPVADLIGICGMGVQFGRQKALLGYYREAGYYVVAGGSYASLSPELYTFLADTVVAGEAEYIWKQFCADFESGSPLPFYRETGVVSLSDSPLPRFDLLKINQYTTATLQFSRGCPFRCEFCDIIVMFGRRPRCKSIEQVHLELEALRALGAHNVFFVDDNLIGNKPAARDLLGFLVDYQKRHDDVFRFGTQASLNLAEDLPLLQQFRQAHFTWVFIGIESPDEQTLKDTLKVQNLHQDLLTSVRTFYTYGIDVLAGFIVGFDNDTPATFNEQYRFIMNSGIQAAMVGLLTALPHTPLYERLEREQRLIPGQDSSDNTRLATNFIPKGMSYDEMLSGYHALYRRLLRDRSIAERIRIKMRYMALPVYSGEYSLKEQVGILARLFVRGLVPGGFPRLYHFLRTFPILSPRKIPQVMVDWIAGLAMQDYVRRHFGQDRQIVARLIGRIQDACKNQKKGLQWDNGMQATDSGITLHLGGGFDRHFYHHVQRHLKRLLRRTSLGIIFYVEELREQDVPDLKQFLQRLARYGDRISVVASERIHQLVLIDSSVFNRIVEKKS